MDLDNSIDVVDEKKQSDAQIVAAVLRITVNTVCRPT